MPAALVLKDSYSCMAYCEMHWATANGNITPTNTEEQNMVNTLNYNRISKKITGVLHLAMCVQWDDKAHDISV